MLKRLAAILLLMSVISVAGVTTAVAVFHFVSATVADGDPPPPLPPDPPRLLADGDPPPPLPPDPPLA